MRHMSFESPVQASMQRPLSMWNAKDINESSRIIVRVRSRWRMSRSLTKKSQTFVQCSREYIACMYYLEGSIVPTICSAYSFFPDVKTIISNTSWRCSRKNSECGLLQMYIAPPLESQKMLAGSISGRTSFDAKIIVWSRSRMSVGLDVVLVYDC